MQRNSNIVYNCHYHVVWCVKYRRALLVDDVVSRLKEILAEVALEVLCEIEEFGAELDHVHLLISCDPQFGIHQVVKRMKGRSSRLLRQEFKDLRTRVPSLWTNSYFVATTGGAPIAQIRKYVEQQGSV